MEIFLFLSLSLSLSLSLKQWEMIGPAKDWMSRLVAPLPVDSVPVPDGVGSEAGVKGAGITPAGAAGGGTRDRGMEKWRRGRIETGRNKERQRV